MNVRKINDLANHPGTSSPISIHWRKKSINDSFFSSPPSNKKYYFSNVKPAPIGYPPNNSVISGKINPSNDSLNLRPSKSRSKLANKSQQLWLAKNHNLYSSNSSSSNDEQQTLFNNTYYSTSDSDSNLWSSTDSDRNELWFNWSDSDQPRSESNAKYNYLITRNNSHKYLTQSNFNAPSFPQSTKVYQTDPHERKNKPLANNSSQIGPRGLEVNLVHEPSLTKPKLYLGPNNQIPSKSNDWPDRANILCSLLKASGRSADQVFSCYLDLGSGDVNIFQLNKQVLRPERAYIAHITNLPDEDFLSITNTKIPLSESSVDIITCYVSIHHFNHFNLMLKEMSRIMISGGLLFIREHDVTAEDADALTPYLDLIHMMEFIYHGQIITEEIQNNFYRHYWSHKELSRILLSVGFELIGFQRYVTANNPQQLYHALYQYNPQNKKSPRDIIWTTTTTEYCLARKNLYHWLKLISCNSQQPQSYYRWFCRTVERKISIPRSEMEVIINQSKSDLHLFKQIFIAVYSQKKFLQSKQQSYLTSSNKVLNIIKSKTCPSTTINNKLHRSRSSSWPPILS